MTEVNLSALLVRLQRLEDERAINLILQAYGHALDYGDELGWLALFEPDATLELHYRDGLIRREIGEPDRLAQGARYVGAAALRSFAAAHSRAPFTYHKHLSTNPAVVIDGDDATVDSYFLRLDASDPGIRLSAAGRYRDRLRRQLDGSWRFTSRRAEIEQQTQG